MKKILKLKKASIVLSVFVISLISVKNSNGQNLLWAKQIGGLTEEYGKSVIVDAIGNTYSTGYFRGTVDFDPGTATYTLTSAGDWDVYVLKLDANGNFVWAKRFGSSGASDDQAFAINIDASGNVYTTGYFRNTVDFDPGVGTSSLTSNGQRDAFISKLDASGNFVWAKQLGGTGDDVGYKVCIDGSGNVYTSGYFNGTVDFDPSAATNTLTSFGGNDIFISKLDASGNYVWGKKMGSSSGDVGTCLTLDASGNLYVAGYYQGIADLDPSAATFTVANAGSGDVFVVKLDALGNFGWAKTMGGTSFDCILSISLDATNNIYTTGYFSGTADFDPSATAYTLTSAGLEDVFVSKLDALGNFVWAKNIGGTGSENGNAIDVDATGNVYTTGQYYGTADFDPSAVTYTYTSLLGNNDIFLSKLDASGNFVWAKSVGSSGDDFGYGLTHNAAGDIYVTGYFTGVCDFDPNAGIFNLSSVGGSSDAYLMKLGSISTGINESTVAPSTIIYPNPTRSSLTIKTNEKIESITIFNLIGEKIQIEKTKTFSVEQLAPGIYILQIETEKEISTVRFVKE